MSPKPFTENSQREYDHYTTETLRRDLDDFEARYGMTSYEFAVRRGAGQLPVMSGFDAHVWLATYEDWQRLEAREVTPRYHRPSANTVICSVVIIACILAAAWIWTDAANARTGQTQPQPIPAPTALLKARKACPNTASLVECRGALRRAYDAVSWQRHARWQAKASTSRDVVVDAIHWAAQKTGVPAWRMIGIGNCESHLFWLAENGQYKSWAQLSTRHRSDPLIARLTWRDPYAVALHVARYIKAHGEGEWQCQSTGGLRW